MKYVFCKNKPNLTLLLPVGCNANCEFCYSKNFKACNKEIDDFYKGLKNTLDQYDNLTKISISGGEPTINLDILEKTLTIISKYANIVKVVLTTNGYNLDNDKCIDIINKYCTHLNISRHQINNGDNDSIFGVEMNNNYNIDRITIPVTMNVVLVKDIVLDDYIQYAKSQGFKSINFRKPFQSNEELHYVEEWKEYLTKTAHSCNGSVTFRWHNKDNYLFTLSTGDVSPCNVCGRFNTSDVKYIYELILSQRGKLLYDWDDSCELKQQAIQPNYNNYCVSFSRFGDKFRKEEV